MAYRSSIEQLIAAASLVDGVAVVWLVAMFRSEVTFAQWLSAYVLLAACTIAVTGLAGMLVRLIGRHEIAAACVVLLAMCWLTWPIWLSAWIDHPAVVRAINGLVAVHPLLAINGLLVHLGVWGEWPMMYKLTSLGQDVPYSLPASVAASATFHFLLGGTAACRRPRERPRNGRSARSNRRLATRAPRTSAPSSTAATVSFATPVVVAGRVAGRVRSLCDVAQDAGLQEGREDLAANGRIAPMWSPMLFSRIQLESYGICTSLSYCRGSTASFGIVNPTRPAASLFMPSIVPNMRVPMPSTGSKGLKSTYTFPRTCRQRRRKVVRRRHRGGQEQQGLDVHVIGQSLQRP